MKGGALFNLLLTNKEELVRDLKFRGRLAYSVHEMVEFGVLGGRS